MDKRGKQSVEVLKRPKNKNAKMTYIWNQSIKKHDKKLALHTPHSFICDEFFSIMNQHRGILMQISRSKA